MKKFIYKNKRAVLTIFFVSFFTLIIMLKIIINKDNNTTIVEENEELEKIEMKENENKEEVYYVDLKGAVKSPGVYSVSSNKRVIDVINMAGGLLDNSDTTYINLSKYVEDEMVIIIYTKEELTDTNNKIDTSINDAYYDINNSNNINNNKDNNGLININTATLEELMTLPGIGQTKANNIVNYRETNGKFNSIEEIQNVKGIGNSIYEKIKNNITI